MSRVFAYIADGKVAEFHPDPNEDGVPITERFTAQYLESCVDVTDAIPFPELNWVATESNGVWSFAPYVAPPATPAEVLANQSAKLVYLKQIAEAQKLALTNRIGTLNDAIELEMATPEEVAELPIRTAQLKAWKTYAVLLGRVTGQAGWPPDVEWPLQPAEGMDLTVSAIAPGSPLLQ